LNFQIPAAATATTGPPGAQVAPFAQNQEIAKLDLLARFAANDHVDVGLKEAQKLFIIGYLTLSNDAFMCLFNSRRQSFHYRINTL
jgi:hypothetical protein